MIQLEDFISQFKDKTISVAVQDLQTSVEIFINADVMMHPASTMKVPVMMEVFRQAEAGLLSLDERKDRRDLSLFQIGLRLLDRKLLNSLPASVPLCAYL
jgi:beta-lactamase class A